MDYTDDGVMAMFTGGHVPSMHATLDGVRSGFATRPAPEGPAVPEGPVVTPPAGTGAAWTHTDLVAQADAAEAAGDPVVVVSPDGTLHVLYRGLDEHIHELTQQ
jgi:hypothetical protein